MDGGYGSGPRVHNVAAFMVAASVIGADECRIAEVLGLDLRQVEEWGSNLRRNGIWLDNGRVLDAEWFEDIGMAVFSIDTLVAEGYLERRIHPVKGPVYRATPGRDLLERN